MLSLPTKIIPREQQKHYGATAAMVIDEYSCQSLWAAACTCPVSFYDQEMTTPFLNLL